MSIRRDIAVHRRQPWRAIACCTAAMALLSRSTAAQDAPDPAAPSAIADAAASQAVAGAQGHVTCDSKPGTRQHCPADTSAGVALLKSSGAAACLLGKTWGYDDTGI